MRNVNRHKPGQEERGPTKSLQPLQSTKKKKQAKKIPSAAVAVAAAPSVQKASLK